MGASLTATRRQRRRPTAAADAARRVAPHPHRRSLQGRLIWRRGRRVGQPHQPRPPRHPLPDARNRPAAGHLLAHVDVAAATSCHRTDRDTPVLAVFSQEIEQKCYFSKVSMKRQENDGDPLPGTQSGEWFGMNGPPTRDFASRPRLSRRRSLVALLFGTPARPDTVHPTQLAFLLAPSRAGHPPPHPL